jgi:hypothetical protein
VVAGAYEAMAHFDLFAAQAMIYFATVSYAEVRQRLVADVSRIRRGVAFSASATKSAIRSRARAARCLRITRERDMRGAG